MCRPLLQRPYRDGCGELLSPYKAGCGESLPSTEPLRFAKSLGGAETDQIPDVILRLKYEPHQETDKIIVYPNRSVHGDRQENDLSALSAWSRHVLSGILFFFLTAVCALRDRVEKHLRSYLILSGGHGLSVRWWLWRRVRGGLSHDDGQVCISALSALCRMLRCEFAVSLRFCARVPGVSLPSLPLLWFCARLSQCWRSSPVECGQSWTNFEFPL